VKRSQAGDLRIAFVGTYPPRRCGIATFTRDLAEATAQAGHDMRPMVLALTDPGGQYEYASEVAYEVRQGVRGDYARAAEFVNYSDVQVVSIQHEYGIFGGDDGIYLLDFLAALRVPAIATLHTVLRHPSASQRAIVQALARRCAGLVVMSRVAADLLERCYDVSSAAVHILPHGIPRMEPRDQEQLKAKFGVASQRMLLTFGLLGPNKGIETVIRALPALVGQYPDLAYFVVGTTHPAIVRRDGEAYRKMLEWEAERLGVRSQVVFRDQFVTVEELCSYLQAADVFVSPYLSEAQVTSGALAYAMGAGAAVVSTPYWHAQELLADGRGCLFPFGDSAALARTLTSLLSTPAELHRVRTAAFEHTRSMTWPRVGQAFLEIASNVVASMPIRPLRLVARSASSLPELRLDHLLRLTDDTGVIQHATFSVPARRSGYCVDDNARGLIVALHADRIDSSPATRSLVTTYLAYLHASQDDDGNFVNFMAYDRTPLAGPRSDDCLGRAVWALGTAVRLAADDGCRALARDMFARALACEHELGPRGTALVVLGLTAFLAAAPDHAEARERLDRAAGALVSRYQHNASSDWCWFEPTLTYDNAMLPLALFEAHLVTAERSYLRIAREALEFLEHVCFRDDRLVLVGNSGWHARGKAKAENDEQAIDASALVLAFRGAYLTTGDHHYLQRMRESFAWFLGANRLGAALYDSSTAGCRDGLGLVEPNQNQGAESTICFLMALLKMLELAGEGLEHPPG
jgi:glycosyltransferase involved in cell wall biosynthesis